MGRRGRKGRREGGRRRRNLSRGNDRANRTMATALHRAIPMLHDDCPWKDLDTLCFRPIHSSFPHSHRSASFSFCTFFLRLCSIRGKCSLLLPITHSLASLLFSFVRSIHSTSGLFVLGKKFAATHLRRICISWFYAFLRAG